MIETTLPPTDVEQVALVQKKLTLEQNARNGINWFYWIGGMSIINSIIYYFGGTTTFVVGLGATQFIDGLASAIAGDLTSDQGTIIRVIGLILDIALAGIFILAGFLGRKRHQWAIITGMVLYTLDAIIFLVFAVWLPLAFHGLALWGLWRGLQATTGLKALKQSPTVGFEQPVVAATPALTDATALPWYKSNVLRILLGIILMLLGIIVAFATITFVITR